MGFLNDIILSQPDSGSALYSLTSTVALVVMLLAGVLYAWRMKLHPLKALIILVVGLLFCNYAQPVILWAQTGFAPGRFGGLANMMVVFVYLPLLALLLAKTLNLPYALVDGHLAVNALSFHMIGRAGCLFTGCDGCVGLPTTATWGVQSLGRADGVYYFPVMLLESLYTLGILAFLLVRIRKNGGVPDGKNLPWMLTLYGLLRFGSEFLRDNEKLFWGLSQMALNALFMAAVGAVLLVLLSRKRRPSPTAADTAKA